MAPTYHMHLAGTNCVPSPWKPVSTATVAQTNLLSLSGRIFVELNLYDKGHHVVDPALVAGATCLPSERQRPLPGSPTRLHAWPVPLLHFPLLRLRCATCRQSCASQVPAKLYSPNDRKLSTRSHILSCPLKRSPQI